MPTQNRNPLGIAVSCFATYGGSGVIAAEIGMAMARRGHRVHFIGNEIPRRVDHFQENIFFHEVEVRDYPVFITPPYTIGLASKIVEVCTHEKIDLLHVHYAIPHATSAYLARQVLKEQAPKLVTTLHGTDITLVGTDRGYLPITRFSIVESDAITAPSQFLRNATYDKLNVPSTSPIEVIPNFVDTDRFKPRPTDFVGSIRRIFQSAKDPCRDEKVIVHTSNFRPVKRVGDVIKIFAGIDAQIPSRLVLIGDGPDRALAESVACELGILEKVRFLGKLESFAELLAEADLFLLPSETESFGLAALEAMSCGVPVIASKVGGLSEVVVHEQSGFLAELGDVAQMAQYGVQLLKDSAMHKRFGAESRARAVELFGLTKLIDRYEDCYYRALESKS